MATDALGQIRDLSKSLSPQDKLRLIGDLVQQLLRELPAPEKKPFRSLHGILAHLGPAPSAEDIDEMRREALVNFPREEFFDDPPRSILGGNPEDDDPAGPDPRAEMK